MIVRNLSDEQLAPSAATLARAESWKKIIQRVSSMTISEARQYFGEALVGLESYRQDVTLKELLILRAFADFMENPSPAMLNVLMERSEGKVEQPLSGNFNLNLTVADVVKYYAEQGILITEQEILAEARQLLEQESARLLPPPSDAPAPAEPSEIESVVTPNAEHQ